MELNRTILFSAILHSMVILALSAGFCRSVERHAPSDLMIVSLLSEMTEMVSKGSPVHRTIRPEEEAAHGKETVSLKPVLSNKAESAADNMKDNREKYISPDTQSKAETALAPGQHEVTTSPPITGHIGFHEGQASGNTQVTIESTGKVSDGQTSDIYALIRAAIEKAKIYPLLARKKRIEGTVVTGFTINSRGYPENIKIKKSSGHEILDSATISILKRSAPLPSMNGEILIPINFRLTDSASYYQR
jgi:TonB family protein